MNQDFRQRQRGVTFIGWILLLLPLALVGYAAMRAAPVYLNYTKVSRAMDSVQKEYAGEGAATVPLTAIRSALGKRFDTDYIYSPKLDEIQVTRAAGGWNMAVDYEHEIPLFFNISLLLTFQKSVDIN